MTEMIEMEFYDSKQDDREIHERYGTMRTKTNQELGLSSGRRESLTYLLRQK